MFPAHYFAARYFAPRYFPEAGLTPVFTEMGCGLYGLHGLSGDSGITVNTGS